jgi:hypothetical protein
VKKNSKKVVKKVASPKGKTVFVKIERKYPEEMPFNSFCITENGTQVEMLDKDENYIKKAFTQFKKAQEILAKYYKEAK